jgi:DNA-binding HxlR family transcriptional regulator
VRAQNFEPSWYNLKTRPGSTHFYVSAGSASLGPPMRIAEMKDHHGCPVQATVNVLSGKWKVQILWHLSFGPRRFAELRKKLPQISEKVLTDQLRQLARDGVLDRQATNSVPPQVTYSLNAEGKKLVPLMESLCNWGSAHFGIKPNLPRLPVRR